MKKALIVSLALCLLCGAACAQTAVGLPNPMVAYDSYEAVCAALPTVALLPAPADAENITYFITDGWLAEIQFTWQGDDYVLRAAALKDDDQLETLHGVYIDFDEDMDEEELGVSVPKTVDELELEYSLKTGDTLLKWYDEATKTGHTLFSTTAGKPDMRVLTLLKAHPEYLGAAAVQ